MSDLNSQLPPIVHFQPISGKVGFPARNGPLIYLPFCNFRCDFCLNAKVVNGEIENIQFDIIREHIEEFKETFVFISGGEPFFHKNLPNLVRELKALGVQVGISTNGTFFDRLKALLEEGLDFVAMDIKTDLNNIEKWSQVACTPEELESVKKSIALINSYVGKDSFGQEFRTTLYPPLVGEFDLKSISKFISQDAVWILQQFRPRLGLLGGNFVADIKPYEDDILYNWLELAKAKIPNTHLRWP